MNHYPTRYTWRTFQFRNNNALFIAYLPTYSICIENSFLNCPSVKDCLNSFTTKFPITLIKSMDWDWFLYERDHRHEILNDVALQEFSLCVS